CGEGMVLEGDVPRQVWLEEGRVGPQERGEAPHLHALGQRPESGEARGVMAVDEYEVGALQLSEGELLQPFGGEAVRPIGVRSPEAGLRDRCDAGVFPLFVPVRREPQLPEALDGRTAKQS